MSEYKYLGPWSCSKHAFPHQREVRDNEAQLIARINEGHPRAIPNARLIEVAPDLLSELMALVESATALKADYINRFGHNAISNILHNDVSDDIAAIAKATGSKS